MKKHDKHMKKALNPIEKLEKKRYMLALDFPKYLSILFEV